MINEYTLPSPFCERMKKLLGNELDDFLLELEKGTASKALLAAQVPCEDEIKALHLSQVPYAENGYYFDFDGIGNTPRHHAGLFYVQDPSAMATLASVSHLNFSTVFDACASPGGKTVHAALLSKKEGFFVSNEFNTSRCKALVGNIERLGLLNNAVTNFDMSEKNELSEAYSDFFELVICDAPCSGEGMFRKYPSEAIGEWSEQNVLSCAKRQRSILSVCAGMVKNGGYLLYSTCTFSLEENELQINGFLKENPEFSLIPVNEKVRRYTADGYVADGCDESIRLCRRFYPHIARGEGQFIALMQKQGATGDIRKKNTFLTLQKPSAAELKIVSAFTDDCIEDFDLSKVFKYKENLIYTEFADCLPPKKLFSCGIKLGEVKKDRFEPHHQLFKCFGHSFKRKIFLNDNDERAMRYIHGETVEADIQNGWCAVMYGGSVLGGGKTVDGVIKNHYPKGLRTV